MKYKWKLMLSYIFSLFGTFIYLKGFFPVKTSSSGFSSIEHVPPPPSDSNILSQLNAEDFPGMKQWTHSDSLPKNFTKLVFIVIDGVREDFLFGGKHLHSTPFLRQQMLHGNAAGFVSRAHAPTVTMPRLKAITTGSIPGYVDVILNLDQTKELKEDNFIHSASADGRSIVFYGDDTWIKLFPGKFKRKDGTTSFFVNDYTIVDNNVTRHLSTELAHPDHFDMMILHYLGLDHIGHVSGPKSPLIDTKLKEMDFVVQQIYEALEKHDSTKASNSLIVVTGDHGMTDKGSHGGTTIPERNVPLVFLSPGIREKTGVEVPEEIEQTDIATTLSVLLGLPIPQSSMGKIIGPVIKLLGKGDQLHAMQYNCHHLLGLAGQSGELDELRNGLGNPLQLYKDALINHATWLQHVNTAQSEFESAMKGYSSCQQVISDALISRVASYNNMELGAGMVLTWLGYLAVVLLWAQAVLTQPPQSNLSGNSPSSPLTWGVLATMGTLIHSLSLLSSSFLEEEHQTWYFITATFLSVLFVSLMTEISGTHLGMSEAFRKGFFSKSFTSPLPTTRDENVVLVKRGKRTESMDSSWDFVELDDDQTVPRSPLGDYKKMLLQNSDAKTAVVVLAVLVSHRVLRSWNQTGIQYADRPDVGDWLNEGGHRGTLTLVFLAGLVCLALLLESLTLGRDPARRYITWLGLTLVFVYRVETGQVALRSTAETAQTTTDQEQSLGLIPARLLYFVIIVILGRIIFLKSMAGPIARDVKVMDYLLSCVVLLGSVLLRPHNVWALVFNLFLYWSVFCQLWPIVNESVQGYSSSNLGKIVLRTTLCYWFGQMSYFSMGNSNSLASIDVSAGYVGIATHTGSLEDAVVIFLLVFATYIGPIVWAMLCLADCVENTSKESKISKTESSQALLAVFSTFAFLRLTPMAFYMILVTAMRYHLFIWSVFAPKLLYEVASTIIYGIMLLAASITTKWITC